MSLFRTLCLILSLLFTITGLQSQICRGSLGDPVVNMDFGKGPNPGPALPPRITSYTYERTGCPQDGLYSIFNNSPGCHGNTWHQLTADHTPGDVDGYMLIVNASFSAGVFYVDTVQGLCGGTTYEFAAWVLNILRPTACNGNGITPNLSFIIETTSGQVLGSYTTGNILASSTANWTQYGLFFTTPPNINSVVLRMTNANPGGCGNDVAIDDITFRPCGPLVQAGAGTNGNSEINLCENKDSIVTMSASVGAGFQQPTYQWQYSSDSGKQWQDIPGATSPQYNRPSNSVIGKYYYRMAVAEAGNMGISTCRVASNMVTVIVNELPARTLTTNSPLCAGNTLQLTASGNGSFLWNGPNGFTANSANPSLAGVTVAAGGTYRVSAISPYGCTNQNSISVSILPPPNLQVTSSANICEGSNAVLQASGAIAYRWYLVPDMVNAIGSGPTLSFAPNGKDTTYQLVCMGIAANGCSDTASSLVNVAAKPFAHAGPDRSVFQGDSTSLAGAVGRFDKFYWTPASYLNNAQILSPRAAPPARQTYTLVAESAFGCGSASDEMLVQVYQTVSIPNAFSPNGDGINDTWEIRALESYPGSIISVFDRYGMRVMQQTNYNKAWDGTINGKPISAGVYYYIIDLGVSNKVLQGSVTLIR